MFETAKDTDQRRVLSGGSLHSNETMSSPTEQLVYTVCVYAYVGAEGLRLKVELCGGRISQLWWEAEVGKFHASSQEKHSGRGRCCRGKTWSVKAIRVKQHARELHKHLLIFRNHVWDTQIIWSILPFTAMEEDTRSQSLSFHQHTNLHAKKWRVSATAVDRGMRGVAPSAHFRHVLKVALLSTGRLVSDPAWVSLLEALGVWNGSFTLISYKYNSMTLLGHKRLIQFNGITYRPKV